MTRYRRSCIAALVLATVSAHAQYLPPPAKDVFRCEVNGKVTYSDDPCPGAKRVDVTPTEGASHMSGKKSVGADVRREQLNRIIAEAMKPLTGMTPEQSEVAQRRFKIAPAARSECYSLDGKLARSEEAAARASKERIGQAQADLYQLRKRYRELRC